MRVWGECTVRGHGVWFLQLSGAWAGTWAADSEVWTVCKLSFCSESSSDGCSIVSQCCIPGSSECQHISGTTKCHNLAANPRSFLYRQLPRPAGGGFSITCRP